MKNAKLLTLVLSIILAISLSAYGQVDNENLKFELSVQEKFRRLQKITDDDERITLNDSIYIEIKKWLAKEESFDYVLDTLESIGYLKSEDEKVKILSWNFPMMDGYNQFYCFVQYREKEKVNTVEFKYNEDTQLNLGDVVSYPNQWYGALYYSVLHNKYKGENVYTLLGFIPNDLFTSKKVVDVLNITEDGLITLGKPIFQTKQGIKKRLVFEYSARVVMKLSYNSKMDMIVYDHLSPSSPNYVGRFQFYGPDFSYDGLKFEKGIWQEYQDIELEY